MSVQRVVLLVGSARPRGESTSEALGRYLLRALEAAGAHADIVWVAHCRSDDELKALTACVEAADLFVLASPMYFDSLPYLVTRAMEHIAAARTASPPRRRTRFAAIVNCGLPEAAQTRVALAICQEFARQAGLDYAGGLGLGGGEALRGRAPDRVGWVGRHITRSLDLAGDALIAERAIPPKATELIGRPLIPALGYTMIGELAWKRQARQNAVSDLNARPFPQPTAPGHARP